MALITGTNLGETLDGTADNDIINANGGDDIVNAGNGDDRVQGGSGNDTINGGAGDDVLLGGSGDDIFVGGTGKDAYYGQSGLDTLDYTSLTTGVRIVMTSSFFDYAYVDGDQEILNSIEQFVLGSGDDQFYGNTANNFVSGGAGSDILKGGTGADQLHGGSGDDVIFGDHQDTVISGGVGYDRFFAEIGSLAIVLDLGTSSIEYASGSRWDDTFYAAGAPSSVKLFGHNGSDNLIGSDFDDYLNGGNDVDSLAGGDGDDILDGGQGADLITGGNGDDILYVDSEDTMIDGGDGYDKIYIRGYATASTYTVGSAVGIEFANGNVEDDTFDGSSSTQTVKLLGQGGNDILIGGSAEDLLYGSTGDDALFGGDGADLLCGGAGVDELVGAGGNDIILIDAEDINIDGGAGYDRVYAETGSTALTLDLTATHIEFVSGSAFGDAFSAIGSTVSVKMLSQDGDDTLTAGDFADEIYGGNGADTISGGAGNDFLSGGADTDVFVFDESWGDDKILDFDASSETIDLSSLGIAYADLTISVFNTINTIVEYAGNSILLIYVDRVDIDATDFDFA